MPTEVNSALPVVAGDVLALRGTGLAAAETWALLCQAAQALQDLFLSNGGVVGGSRAGPVVTPHTLELTPRGRVTLQLAPPETARAYLPPEYRPGRMYSDTDSEKMWMYSLGRALVDTTPRAAALTGSVSVSPTSALQSVLAAMTEPDPRRRASLMNLLDVISEYCRTRLQSKPFTHIVMDMYREVVRSSQYAARRRLAMQSRMINMKPQRPNPHHPQPPPPAPSHYSKHQAKGNLFKSQSRNSRSHPNLQCLSGREPTLTSPKPQFQSQMNIESINPSGNGVEIHHGRTNSQPVTTERTSGITQTRSNHNLAMNGEQIQPSSNVYSDPIYALPVKPFLSSQDVRVNGLSAKSTVQRTDVYAQPVRVRNVRNGGSSQPNIAHLGRMTGDEVVYGAGRNAPPPLLHRQYSNPQLPSRNSSDGNGGLRNHLSNQGLGNRLRIFTGNADQQDQLQRNVEVSGKSVHGPVPPKPPRIITSVNRPAVPLPDTNGEPPPKPPRNAIRNGPRARRGKPVQRAPSRLYRAIVGPTRCLNKTQCVGPEFVVRANQPPKLLTVGDVKNGCGGRIVVILLTGQRIDVTCDPQKITAGELFQAIVQAESLDENFTLGLAALLAGDFAMLPPETKLNKVAPPGWLNSGKSKGPLGLPTSFMLYLRLRFFLPSLRGIRSWISKHLLYLQIRRCILEQQLVCPLTQLVNLTGLALQAEFGNYSVNEHGRGDYFLLEHYIPESLILSPDHQTSQLTTEALKSRLHQAHRDRRGLDANSAEEMFITHAQGLHDYGSHFYIATVDTRELDKIADRIKKIEANRTTITTADRALYPDPDIYQIDGTDYALYGKIEYSSETTYGNIEPIAAMKHHNDDIYAVPKSPSSASVAEKNNNNISNSSNRSRSKKTETNVWLAIHGQGLKLFERAGRPRERKELIRVQWRDIQTLSYSKNCLVVYTKFGGKRAKFKLRMDHKKSYYAFKLTSLHHQFFLKLKSELTSLQGLQKDFGVALAAERTSPKVKSGKTSALKISIGEGTKGDTKAIGLEELQNKENENPQREIGQAKCEDDEPVCYTPEEDALYAQVHARLEPEGASRDTEDEGERAQMRIEEAEGAAGDGGTEEEFNYSNIGGTGGGSKQGTSEERAEVKHPEELYAAINKSFSKKNGYSTSEEVWDGSGKNSGKSLAKVKTSSLPNYGTPRQNTGYRTPSLPRRLGVKMGTRAIYSSLVQRDPGLTDDLESLSLKSDTASSIQSASVHSTESPMPEAYVLNADIRTDDETFRIANDESMSASLVARLEELSFTEERILHTIKLERGHGGSIGLQVTEGNDGGVYVQAVSVGGSADMAGNVNKGDRIVAINGQSLLNLRYEDALKLLQSSSETVELVLSQFTSDRADALRQHHQEPLVNNYLQNLRFDISSEADVSGMTNKWLSHKSGDVASVQNTSSAYSSAASSAMVDAENPPPVPPRRKRRRPLPECPAAPTPPSPVNLSRVRKSAAPAMRPPFDPPKSNNNTSVPPSSRTATSISIVAIESPPPSGNNDKSPRDKLTREREELAENAKSRDPPLLFTLRDFENVMSASTQGESPVFKKSPPNTFANSIDSNFDDVVFRVTPADTPFEKLSQTFGLTFTSETPDEFIFEDYQDRSNRLTRKSFFFEEDFPAHPLPPKTPPKVRFIIEPTEMDPPEDPPQEEDLEILNIVTNSESFLGVETEDWWISGRRSPLKIEEIIDSPSIKIAPQDDEMTSELEKPEDPSIDPAINQSINHPTCHAALESTSPPDPIKPNELNESIPKPSSLPENLDQVPQLLRNSFLDKMLSEESYPSSIEDDTTCSIIATHPKSKASDLELSNESSGLGKIDKTEDIGGSIVGSGPALGGKNPLVMGKNAGTIKCEVMNELLSNFHSIKLKTVEHVDRTDGDHLAEGENDVINGDESLVNSACRVDKKTDDCSLVSNVNCQNDGNDISHIEGNNVTNDDKFNDKCAIDSLGYDNDNNDAMTGVGVREREKLMVGITPGRVKSFVRNYEISVNETSDCYSKCRDCDGVGGMNWEDWGTRGNSPRFRVGGSSEEMGCTLILRKESGVGSELGVRDGKKKKSVKFDGGHTVIQGGAGVKVKRRAPGRPAGCEERGGIVDIYEEVRRKESFTGRREIVQMGGKESQVNTSPLKSTPGTSTSRITPPPLLKPPYVFYLRV